MDNDPVYVTFEFKGDLGEQVQKVTAGIKGLDDESSRTFGRLLQSGTGTSASMKELNEQLGIQKRVIADLEGQYKKYKAEFDKVNVGGHKTPEQSAAFEDARNLFRQVRAELDAEKKGLEELEQMHRKAAAAAEKDASKQVTLLIQMRNIREEMARLANADGTVSPQNLQRYEELKTKLGDVGTAFHRVREEQKYLTTTGNAQLAGLMSGITGLAGAFSAAQGVMSLFVKDDEKLAAIQTKLQAAMAITIGLQQVSTTLHATSAFRINTVTKATTLWKNAVALLNTQLGLSVGLSKALAAGGIGLLIAAITGVVLAYRNWNREQELVNKAKLEGIKNAQAEITEVRSLETILKNSNNSYDARKAALDKLKEIMPSYNATLKKEGELIEDNTGALMKYIEQVKNAALAKVYAEKLAQAQTDYNEWSSNLGNREKNVLMSGALGDVAASDQFLYNVLTKQFDQLDGKIRLYEKELEKYQAKALSGETPQEGSKKYWEQQQKNAETALSAMSDMQKGSKEWNDAVDQYSKATEKLKGWDIAKSQKTGDKAASDANRLKSETADRLREIEEMRKKIADQQQSGELELRQQQIDLMEEGAAKVRARIALDFDRREAEIIRKGEEFIKAQQEVERKIWEAANPKWKEEGKIFTPDTTLVSQLPEWQKTYLAQSFMANKDARDNSTSQLQEKLLREFEDFHARRERIVKEYNDKINGLERGRTEENKAATDSAIAEAGRRMEAELTSLNEEVLKASDFYEKLFSDLSRKGYATLLNFSKGVNGVLASAKDFKTADGKSMVSVEIPTIGENGETIRKAVNITIEEFARLKKKADEITKHLSEKNPFKGIASGFASIANIARGNTDPASRVDDLSNAIEALAVDVKNAKSLMLDWSASLGGIFGSGVQDALGEITELADGIMNVGMGIGRFAAGDVIGGITSTLSGLASIVTTITSWEEKRIAYQQKLLLGQMEYNRLVREQHYELISTVDQVKTLKDNTEALNWLLSHGFIKDGSAGQWNVVSGQYEQRNKDILAEIGSYERLLKELSKRNWDTGWQSSGSLSWEKQSGSIASAIKGQSDDQIRDTLALLDAQGKLNGSVKELYDNWVKSGDEISRLKDEIAGLYTQMEEFAVGQSFDSFLDSAMTAISELKGGVTNLAGFTEDALTKAVLSSFKYKVLSNALQPFYDQLSDKFINDFEGIDTNWADEWKSRLEEVLMEKGGALNTVFDSVGVDMADTVRQASQKGLEAMNQDSADALNGRFTTMVYYQDKMNTTLVDMRGFMLSGLDRLNEIAINTGYCRRLDTIDSNLDKMNRSVEAITRDGLMLKK